LKIENNMPLVSVAIITYNQKEYLKECIDSVLKQDYNNIEIVVADDCSTDGTQDMLREYDKQYPHKFVLKLAEKNQGITSNSNLAVLSCSGEYIAMTGGDDIYLPTKISKQVEFLKKNKEYTLCGTYTNIIDKDSNIVEYRKDFKSKQTPIYSLCELISSNNGLVPVVSYMFRKNAAPREGFDFRLPIASDSLFYFHIANKGKIWVIQEYLTSYRVHNSHASKLGYRDDTMVSLALCEYYFPQCLNAINNARHNLFYSIGRNFQKENEFVKAKSYYKYSFIYKLKIKSIIAYVLAVLKIKR